MATTSTPTGHPPEDEWAEELQELATRREQAAAMGGEEALRRMKSPGRLNARERIATLLDAGTFRGMGRIAGKGEYDASGRCVRQSPVNAIFGSGLPDGRKIVVSADDFSLRAGSSEPTISDKWVCAERFGVLDLIDPRETRGMLCDWVGDAYAVLQASRSGGAPHIGGLQA
jgi:acetyl-CoA carboxylase carboxyltransferase component